MTGFLIAAFFAGFALAVAFGALPLLALLKAVPELIFAIHHASFKTGVQIQWMAF
nr:hypothetical protein [uncultured Cohaesibacter sp.]